mgnify:CR=1 FL=1
MKVYNTYDIRSSAYIDTNKQVERTSKFFIPKYFLSGKNEKFSMGNPEPTGNTTEWDRQNVTNQDDHDNLDALGEADAYRSGFAGNVQQGRSIYVSR